MNQSLGARGKFCVCLKRQKLSVANHYHCPSYETRGRHGEICTKPSGNPARTVHSLVPTIKSRHAYFTFAQGHSCTAKASTLTSSTRQQLSALPRRRMLSSLRPALEENLAKSATEGVTQSRGNSSGYQPRRMNAPQRVTMSKGGALHRAVVAFGSNVGNRVSHIENAISSMKAAGLEILKLSRLYETKAMYYDNQDSFLNGVAVVETTLSPIELLDVLQRIEHEQGRTRGIDKGPRTLDLDIILYDQEQIDHERLKVPHPLMMEREFVLRPLANVLEMHYRIPVPSSSLPRNSTTQLPTLKDTLNQIRDLDNPMRNVTVLSPKHPFITPDDPQQPTLIMSILNITPDSFSDGGKLSPADTDMIVATAASHISSGATILDVGGQSTRPNSTMLSVEEELGRVLPALRAIRTIPEVASGQITISLDTFYSDVARRCIEEGLVDIINDISAGQLDPKMLSTVAELGKTIVLMHMRGTPQTMGNMTDYGRKGIVTGVADEVAQRVNEALAAGILPWRIILDPGIGFAKNQQQNLKLLRAGTRLIASVQRYDLGHYPWLVGTSRKGFIGKVTMTADPNERVWGTAACVTAAVAGGAQILRVHDVEEMSKVVKMADALYRFEKETYQKEKMKVKKTSTEQLKVE